LRLDIVIPAHNEEHRIGRTLRVYRSGCADPATRFLVALDACTDDTARIVREHAAADDRVGLFEYAKLGKGGVIRETMRRSDADLVGFVDADCATPPAEMLRLAAVFEQSRGDVDAVIASRHHAASVLPVRRSGRRRVASAGFAFCARRLLRMPYRDTQCGAKIVRREALAPLLDRVSATDLLFDVDLLLAARETGRRVVEVPTVWIDQDGSRVDVVADTRRMGVSLMKLWAGSRGRRRHTASASGVASARA
jgi:glycosyltransferase involved in cell wall biosynthesis